MTEVGVDALDDKYRVVLKEFFAVMKPVVVYLDVLQGGHHVYLGCVLPRILKLKTELTQLAMPIGNFGSFLRIGILKHVEARLVTI